MGEEKLSKNSTEVVPVIKPITDVDTTLDNILILEEACFPPDWQYDNAKEYYADIIQDPQNINLFLYDENDKVTGYILARPHNLVVSELKNDDPFLTDSDNARYYIDTIQILPELQGKGGGKNLILAVCDEAKKRGVTQFSIHARTVNHLSDVIKSLFKDKVTLVRQIDSWKYASGEPYEYIEWDL